MVVRRFLTTGHLPDSQEIQETMKRFIGFWLGFRV